MTAKTRYTFTVNAVDAGSNVLKTIYTDADSYEGKSHTIVYPKYLTGTGNIVTYSKDNNTYGESKIAQAQNETYTVSYTAYDGVAYFVEVEDVISATGVSNWNCSNGGAVRGFTDAKSIFTVPATGVYDITYAACNNNVNNELAITLSKNETEIATKSDLRYISINYIKTTGIVTNNNVSLASGDVLKLTPSTTNGIVDYMLIELKSVPATIGATGWATFSSDYALDFTGISDFEAYMITGHDGNVVTKSQVTGTVPAGTGLLLKGAAGSYNIPIVGSSSTDVSANKLVAGTGADISAVGGNTRYVLGVSDNGTAGDTSDDFAEFQKITETPATVAKGKAYLELEAGLARSMRFSGDVTAIENVEAAAEAKAKEGKFIENGKLVIVKNGQKFNAAGAKLY